jgi:hypothetical protein
VNKHPDVIRELIMSDEAHFELPACVNKQDRNGANPNELHVKPLRSQTGQYGLGYKLSVSLVFIFSRIIMAVGLL